MTTHRSSRRAEDGPVTPTWLSTARMLYADRVPRTYGPRPRPRHRRRRRITGDATVVAIVTGVIVAVLAIAWLVLLAVVA
ncbi:hypothetical protein ACFORJ_07960 [Corynebacterium hansenii]|uniref:Uncharacterized protein n=1 Tax=Corynebacterium hansenii TaxID=394964 RepID=A0ABV7ZQK7_9CORY|nr:hypothetical protein [Corynebacterium hansenii]WJZ00686.1 hypothetical protein CHAN_10425 [Corynebacterium hansenii]